jgi:uncharacterized protein
MYFEWDNNKAESNAVKHGITFEEAITAFANPAFLFTEDSLHSWDEERQWAIRATENGLIVVIVFTMREQQIRVISARPAAKQECQEYESGT